MRALLGMSFLLILTGCTAVNSTEVVPYRQVAVSPAVGSEIREIDSPPPMNVTGTMVGFY